MQFLSVLAWVVRARLDLAETLGFRAPMVPGAAHSSALRTRGGWTRVWAVLKKFGIRSGSEVLVEGFLFGGGGGTPPQDIRKLQEAASTGSKRQAAVRWVVQTGLPRPAVFT